MIKLKKLNKRKVGFILLFILGLILSIYPIISNYYYRSVFDDEIKNFQTNKNTIDNRELEKRMKLARDYNKTLDPSRLADPFNEDEKKARAEYAKMLEVKEMIGYIEIPQIDVYLPTYAGTSDEVLEKGAGHLEGTSLPIGGESTHTVITAHRGLPKAKLFRDLDKLKIGDVFYFHNINEILAYQVDNIETVEPWDFEKVLVSEGKDYATLLTCTPYMINSQRLLVRGKRVPYVPKKEKQEVQKIKRSKKYKNYLIISLAILSLIILFYSKIKIRKRKNYDK